MTDATKKLADRVLEAYCRTDDARWNEISASLIRHLHAFVQEVRLTSEEWLVGIDFLTRTGKTCEGPRQEFILLSDALGVSSAVDDLASAEAHGATESALLGPFYASGSRVVARGGDLSEDVGERVWVHGRVTSVDGEPIPHAELDVWHSSPNQLYAVQDPQQPPMNCRGKITADAQGRFEFRTTRPVSYPVPTDGPVGQLLAKSNRHPMRPAHIHFTISAQGYRPVTTQIFTADDPYIDSDAVFGVKDSLLATYTRNSDADIRAEWVLRCDFVLNRAHADFEMPWS